MFRGVQEQVFFVPEAKKMKRNEGNTTKLAKQSKTKQNNQLISRFLFCFQPRLETPKWPDQRCNGSRFRTENRAVLGSVLGSGSPLARTDNRKTKQQTKQNSTNSNTPTTNQLTTATTLQYHP